jgi:hypothetical protein
MEIPGEHPVRADRGRAECHRLEARPRAQALQHGAGGEQLGVGHHHPRYAGPHREQHAAAREVEHVRAGGRAGGVQVVRETGLQALRARGGRSNERSGGRGNERSGGRSNERCGGRGNERSDQHQQGGGPSHRTYPRAPGPFRSRG